MIINANSLLRVRINNPLMTFAVTFPEKSFEIGTMGEQIVRIKQPFAFLAHEICRSIERF